MRALPAIVVIALLVTAAVLVADRPGSVAIEWQGWRVDTSVAVMVLAAAAVGVAVAVIYNVLRWIVGGPRTWVRARRERRRRDGYRALTQGMVAVAAGDAEEAQKLARKADALLAEPPLTLLLSAQAAQLNGDETAAGRYFTAMLERPETAFLGLRGLLMQAMKIGDEATALRLAERAKALRPRTPWVLTSLLELQSRAGRWSAAEATLVETSRRKALPAPESRHRHAVLLHQNAAEAEAQGRPSDAMRLESKALALAPEFAPIAERYAQMLNLRGQTRRARRALEAAWRAAPHPALATAYRALFADEPALLRFKRMERLAALQPDHVESQLALAAAALEARLWGEARRYLTAAGAAATAAAPPRVCRLMAELEEAEHGDHAAARTWLARAAVADTPDPAWLCDACGAESASWSALCPNCRGFATLAWSGPVRTAAPRRALAAPDAALLPAKP
ncbi:MAG TPA: heme biosynthesis HemY N-terminal domain-containing protein [Stellaceae bacterium]|nr:heme biosynthesis HemY N-terminal domain-containing protein [Stellaceae bacterium]